MQPPAVVSRERRKTAGQRMSHLVGKALEDDEAFWTHSTWKDEEASEDDSYNVEDEDEEHRVDAFDSDFNDSESDHEAAEEEAGQEEERRLQQEERHSKKKSSAAYTEKKKKAVVDIVSAGRELMQKKKGSAARRRKTMGDGMNAGLVLNLPTAPPVGPSAVAPNAPVAAASAAAAPMLVKKPPPPPLASPLPTLASMRSRRSSAKSMYSSGRKLRAGTVEKTMETTKSVIAETQKRRNMSVSANNNKRRRYTQEELLMEAVSVTELENQRWLLGRKRVQDLANRLKDAAAAKREVRGKVISKFHSRRGCFNTITFPEMDAVPAILTRTQKPVPPPVEMCVVTGKKAQYRDPKTNKGYHDMAAFKELRRRFEAGEALDQRDAETATRGDVTLVTREENELPASRTCKKRLADGKTKESESKTAPDIVEQTPAPNAIAAPVVPSAGPTMSADIATRPAPGGGKRPPGMPSVPTSTSALPSATASSSSSMGPPSNAIMNLPSHETAAKASVAASKSIVGTTAKPPATATKTASGVATAAASSSGPSSAISMNASRSNNVMNSNVQPLDTSAATQAPPLTLSASELVNSAIKAYAKLKEQKR